MAICIGGGENCPPLPLAPPTPPAAVPDGIDPMAPPLAGPAPVPPSLRNRPLLSSTGVDTWRNAIPGCCCPGTIEFLDGCRACIPENIPPPPIALGDESALV